MKRGSSKPCPGCGESEYNRPVDTVCSNCKRKLKNWDEHVVRINAQEDMEVVKLQDQSHWYPGFYMCGPYAHVEGFDDTRDALRMLFAELAELLTKERLDWNDAQIPQDCCNIFFKPHISMPPAKGERYGTPVQYPSSDGDGSSYNARYIRINKKLLETIRALWDHTARFAEMAYLGGVQDGRNILLQLNSGGMSSEELAKHDMHIAERLQDSAYLHKKLGRKKKQEKPAK